MRRSLKPHPDFPCGAVANLQAEVSLSQEGWVDIGFFLEATMADLRLPAPVPPARAAELWRHTCFEAFVLNTETNEYVEMNFAPSRQWATYHFTGYRQDMREVTEITPPHLEIRSDEESLHLQAKFTLHHIPGFDGKSPLRLGLSAVIETEDGRISYWALNHPPGRPDFHHSDCFAIDLGAKR